LTTIELSHGEQAAPEPPQLVAGRFLLHEQIGTGRLGDIYDAVDEGYRELGVGGRVAIQLLPDRIALDQGLFSKLKLGYTVLRASPHPNIVRYLDCDHDGRYGYLVMERLDGASLRFVLDDTGSLPFDETLPVVRAIGDGLQFLHAKSMVHGQLTARNVFITETLDVRLLDIVPLDSGSAFLRGVASRDPFSRCEVRDDIYALACLTYEILAGKHPFNFQPPSEASLAGIEPDRVRSLPERPWLALRRALSFDADERPATVAEFLGELGITGTERLRPSADTESRRNAEPSPRAPAKANAVDAGTTAHKAPAPKPAPPVVVAAPAPPNEKRRAIARRKRASRIRATMLAVVLAGLATWYFAGQPRDDLAEIAALAESYLPSQVAESPVVVVEQSAPVAAVSTSAPPAVAETVPEPETREVESAIDEAPAVPEAADEPAVTAETVDDPGVSETVAEPGAPAATLVQSFVTVYERDGAARITYRQPVGATTALFWWTGDDTAVADSDYIALEAPVLAFASGEEAETVHIPLVNDSLPEAREVFYVFLGQRNAASGRLEPIAQIRVEVNDDD
jgi:hypothetical protein